MIDFSRVGNNLLVLLILFGFGYLIFLRLKNEKLKDKVKGLVSRGKI